MTHNAHTHIDQQNFTHKHPFHVVISQHFEYCQGHRYLSKQQTCTGAGSSDWSTHLTCFDKHPPEYCAILTICTKMHIFKYLEIFEVQGCKYSPKHCQMRRVWSSGKRKRVKLPDSVTPSNFRLVVFAIVTSSDM